MLAGAGSGKTRVLTTRIAWLMTTGQLSPGGVMAVTFTNKAAKEMLTRISAQLPINTRGMWVGTFHGLCNRLLRTHYRDAGLPQLFQILDSQDQLAAGHHTHHRVVDRAHDRAARRARDQWPPSLASAPETLAAPLWCAPSQLIAPWSTTPGQAST